MYFIMIKLVAKLSVFSLVSMPRLHSAHRSISGIIQNCNKFIIQNLEGEHMNNAATAVRKKIFIAILVLFMTFVAAEVSTVSRKTPDVEKKTRCEKQCKTRWWNCLEKTNLRTDKGKKKAMGICDSFYTSCLTRCQEM